MRFLIFLHSVVAVISFRLEKCANRVDIRSRLILGMSTSDKEDIRKLLGEEDFQGAYQILKRNPLVPLRKEDARVFLNNLDDLVATGGKNVEEAQQQKIEASLLVYSRLSRQHILRGYGCIDGEYPEKTKEISPQKMEEITGLPISAMTPKERTSNWRFAGIGLCVAEYLLGEALGIDPLYTLIPGTFFLFGYDQLRYRGAYFESFYQKLFPEYKKKIIYHEAGHFLVAYILGAAVRQCVTSAWDALKYPDITGQAGTVFFDSKFQEEMASQKLTRTSIDRLSVILMAGIAAEAAAFGKAEGGSIDEQGLIGLLTTVQPPWNIVRVQGQARWAASQAVLLIREHQASYDALVIALEEKRSVGDCILAIEDNLPTTLPSAQRIQDSVARKKAAERGSLLRFIQKRTFQVGGIDAPESDAEATRLQRSQDAAADAFEGQVPPVHDPLTSFEPTPAEPQSVVRSFTQTIRDLEKAFEDGKLEAPSSRSGGIWLNNLETFRTPKGADFDIINRVKTPSTSSTTTSASPSSTSTSEEGKVVIDVVDISALPPVSIDDLIILPPALEGYEERIKLLQAELGDSIPNEAAVENIDDTTANTTLSAEVAEAAEAATGVTISIADSGPAADTLIDALATIDAAVSIEVNKNNLDLVNFAKKVMSDPRYFLDGGRSERTRLTLASLLQGCDAALLPNEIKAQMDDMVLSPSKWRQLQTSLLAPLVVADGDGSVTGSNDSSTSSKGTTGSRSSNSNGESDHGSIISNVDAFAVSTASTTAFVPSSPTTQLISPTDTTTVDPLSPTGLLLSHRGFQLKKMELERANNKKRMEEIEQRMKEIKEAAALTPTKSRTLVDSN